jgi:hypothetical protein
MWKAKICVVVAACALGASAFAGERPPYHPNIKPIQSVAQPAGQQPPYRPNIKPIQSGQLPPYRPGAWSMVISAPRS